MKRIAMQVAGLFAAIILINPSATFSMTKQEKLLKKAKEKGSVRVIVGLNVPYETEGYLPSEKAVGKQRAAIAQAQEKILAKLSRYKLSHVKRFHAIPYMAIMMDEDGLKTLLNDHRLALSIEEDIPVPPTLNESVPFIHADDAHAQGFEGAGWTVAILDTGIRKQHEFIGTDKVVSEACYSSNLCPNGKVVQIGAGAGTNCSLSGCDHGTHVAGIVAGNKGTDVAEGVAPKANLIAIQVFSRVDDPDVCKKDPVPCIRSYTGDTIDGLQRVYDLRNKYKIASVNMSLGGGEYDSYCDSDSRKAIIDNLRSVGIATVISSGNGEDGVGYNGSVGAPGCISSAITVGATLDIAGAI